MGDDGEDERDGAVHEPVREAAEALAFGADLIGENFTDVNPDDGALRKREEGNEADEEPDEEALVLLREENVGDAAETKRGADGTDQEERLAADLVDDRHGEHRE